MDHFCCSYYKLSSRVFVLVNCENVLFHAQRFYELNVVVVFGGGGVGESRACHTAVYLHQITTLTTPSTQHK
jgi:hypothetical protein